MGDLKTYINKEYEPIKLLVALVMVIITSSALVEAAPLNNSIEPVPTVHTQPEQVEQTDQAEEAQKPVEQERTVTWRDNPNNCDLTTQYVLADTLECKDKPKSQTTATQSTHAVGCENYRQLVSQYEWNVEVALKVMKAESGCNPGAVGDQYAIRGVYAPSCGLFQIRTLQGRPSCNQLQNPTTNVEWAIKLYRASGWQPWSVCKNGKVSCY